MLKLHVTGGRLYLDTNGQGPILKSSNGICIQLVATDAGELVSSTIACPE